MTKGNHFLEISLRFSVMAVMPSWRLSGRHPKGLEYRISIQIGAIEQFSILLKRFFWASHACAGTEYVLPATDRAATLSFS